jgi:hypothetical protein
MLHRLECAELYTSVAPSGKENFYPEKYQDGSTANFAFQQIWSFDLVI